MRLGPVVLPVTLAALIAALVLLSIAGAVTAQNGARWLLETGILIVPQVWQGQVWRLFTFVFFEGDPLGLIFSCLTLYWFGRDLIGRWGSRRFLAAFFALTGLSAAVTCLVGLAWPMVAMLPHAGSAPVLDGLVVAWGVLYGTREIRLWGVVRLTGTWLVRITIGGTVLYALFGGFAHFVPHFAAELLALLWLAGIQPRRDAGRKAGASRAARDPAWTFGSWYDRERRR